MALKGKLSEHCGAHLREQVQNSPAHGMAGPLFALLLFRYLR